MTDSGNVRSIKTIKRATKIDSPPPLTTAVKNWLAMLPLTNINLSVRRIIHSLRKLKSQAHPLSANHWFEILELFHPKVDYFSTQLRTKYLSDISSRTQKEKQRYIVLAYLMNNEIAQCYSDLTRSTTIIQPNREQLTISYYRAISYLTQILVASYELYLQTPIQLWQHLNQLYHSAEKNNLENVVFKDPTETLFTVEKKSISNAYKRALLLASANPYQLSRIDIEKLFNVLLYWSDRTQIDSVHQPKDLYIIDLASNKGPHYVVLVNSVKTVESYRALHTVDLSHYLEKILSELPSHLTTIKFSSEEKTTLNRALVESLMQHWSNRKMRFADRIPHQGELHVCVGLSATHYYLNQESEAYSTMASSLKLAPTKYDHIPEVPLAPASAPCASLISAPKNQTLALDTPIKTAKKELKHPIGLNFELSKANKLSLTKRLPKKHEKQLWQIVNRSDEGYCLQPSLHSLSHIQPGVIIGIQQKNQASNATLQIYAIRWIQSNSDKSFVVGVQLLAFKADPIAVEGNRQLHQLRGLLLNDIGNPSQKMTIIIPAIPYKTGDIVKISNQYQQYLVKLLDQLVINHSYGQFSYTLLTTGNLRRWANSL